MKLNIGKTDQGKAVGFDLPTLIETRMLVVANSGGGKSYALRKLLESTHGLVQQIVIDLEGEFSTLREQYDYIVAGKGGDVPATPKTAELLAQRLLELKVSAICDLYELKAHERVKFVRLFLESLLRAPKSLYHPVLVVIDEAHHFAPQVGDCESYAAVIDLCTRGRKRGLCAVLATQRISKLHKDACAEMLNKMIGRTSLDIDQKRAADELGMIDKASRINLRNHRPGEFDIYGPALLVDGKEDTGVVSFRVGEVKTRHPKVGNRQLESAPAPTAKVKDILAKLIDLPREAEEQARTADDLRKEITDLKRKLTLAEKSQVKACNHEEEIAKLRAEIKLKSGVLNSLHAFKNSVTRRIVSMQQSLADLQKTIDNQLAGHFLEESERIHLKYEQPVAFKILPKTERAPRDVRNSEHVSLPPGELAVLTAAIQYGNVDRKRLSVITGYKRSSRDAYIARLLQKGLIDVRGQELSPTDSGRDALGDSVEPLPEGQELIDYWMDRLPGGERETFSVLIKFNGKDIARTQIDDETGYKRSSRDAYLARLKARGLVEFYGQGRVKASDLLFVEGR